VIGAALSLLPPITAGYLLARRAWPSGRPTVWAILLRLALALGLGVGASSLTVFLWYVTVGPRRPGLFAVELCIFGGLSLLLLRIGRTEGVPAPRAPGPGRLLPLAFTLVLACAAAQAGWSLGHSPHGDWDAWAIWNLRARFLYRAGDHWADAFSPLIPWSHPDYPLLVSGSVARGWGYAGHETTAVPRLLAALFLVANVGLLMGALALLRGPAQGWLGGIALLATPSFLEQATAQYADVPLAFFFLGSAAVFEALDRGVGPAGRLAALAGLLTALAAWTKNEGLLFLVATVGVRGWEAVRRRPGWRAVRVEAAAFLAGALPVLAVLAYFKARLAPVNDLVAGQGRDATLARLADPGRYLEIALAFLREVWLVGPGAVVVLALYALLLGRAPRPAAWAGHGRTLLAVMLVGYFGVYLTTPNDLPTHLATSLDRLLVQLWPLALLAFFLAVALPSEARATTAGAALSGGAGSL
jgi:hypothetical protein